MQPASQPHCENEKAPYHLVERLDGPALIAHVFAGKSVQPETRWHTHVRGQFMYIEAGLICIRTRHDLHPLTPHCVNWMPPGIEHTIRILAPVTGWGVFVAPDATDGLPPAPAIVQGNPLMRELVHRAASWANNGQLDDEQQRLMDVLMGEMRHARVPEDPFTLPMPTDRRLLHVAEALLAHPGDTRNRDDWATAAGLSARSLTRLFREQTGLTFEQWRQQARLGHALEQLGQGRPVAHVADALGYASVSAFVAMFRRTLGQSPGRYLSLDTP